LRAGENTVTRGVVNRPVQRHQPCCARCPLYEQHRARNVHVCLLSAAWKSTPQCRQRNPRKRFTRRAVQLRRHVNAVLSRLRHSNDGRNVYMHKPWMDVPETGSNKKNGVLLLRAAECGTGIVTPNKPDASVYAHGVKEKWRQSVSVASCAVCHMNVMFMRVIECGRRLCQHQRNYTSSTAHAVRLRAFELTFKTASSSRTVILNQHVVTYGRRMLSFAGARTGMEWQ